MTQPVPPQAQNHRCPCHPTLHQETPLLAVTCLSVLAVLDLLWSSTALGKGLALLYELSGSIWETVMSTLSIIWSGYVFSSLVAIRNVHLAVIALSVHIIIY